MTQNKGKIFSEKKHIIKRKLFVIGMPIICACIVLIVVLTTIIIPNNRNERLAQKFKNVNVGDIITFGSYEQDNNISNGKESIEWLVLAKENNKLFVISNKALDCQKYNAFNTAVIWENCPLRSWLNDTFLNSAFSKKEQSLIQTTTVSADMNPEYDTDPGNGTDDKVFLLSITEAEKYFATDESRKCETTAYARANGAYHRGDNVNCWWWLRSPGSEQRHAATIDYDGEFFNMGSYVSNDEICVRPAMWISIENSTNKVSKENTVKSEKVNNSSEIFNQNNESGRATESSKTFNENNENKESKVENTDKKKAAVIGDIITFGTYEQDNNISNGKEPIEWQVISKENNKLFIISKKALDCQKYNDFYTDVTWETCSLRSWLNNTFLNTAFSEKERSLIQNTTVFADKNPEYDTDPGNQSDDKVFLLSIKEAEKYFATDELRKCEPTDYVVSNEAYTGMNTNNCWWLLRSPGGYQNMVAYIYGGGEVSCAGYFVDNDFGCIRPAMWIKLDF